MKENMVFNSGFVKPNNSWLGRWFLIKTFDNWDENDLTEIRRMLDESNEVPS
jgi:hypothetical protein